MDFVIIISFLGASILLSLMPGPDNIFVLTESLTKGYKNGIAISVGLCMGVLLHTLAAATGLSILIQQSSLAFSVLKYLGATYLFYLAFLAVKEKKVNLSFDNQSQNVRQEAILPLIKKGFFMNVLNPKVSLFFIAFLPQFITADGFNISVQMIILGILFMIQAFIIFSCIAILSGKLTSYLHNPKFWHYSKWGKILVLTLLALSLALSKK